MKTKSNLSNSKPPLPKQQRRNKTAKQPGVSRNLMNADELGNFVKGALRPGLDCAVLAPLAPLRTPPEVNPTLLALIRERASRTLYYPAALFDWRPLYRLSHLCDTFVYSDWGVRPEHLEDNLKIISTKPPVRSGLRCDGAIETVDIGNLTLLHSIMEEFRHRDDDLPRLLEDEIHRITHDGVWCRKAKIIRTIGAEERPLTLIYIRAGGLITYLRLFYSQSVAPRILFAPNAGESPHGFYPRDSLFAAAVHAQPAQPEFIAGPFRGWDWQILALNMVSTGLGTVSLYGRTALLPPTQVHWEHPTTGREITLFKGNLEPGTVPDGVGAIVIHPKDQRRFSTKPMTQFVLHHRNETRRRIRSRVFLAISGAPLMETLEAVTTKCKELGISSIASKGIGYEDEALGLRMWLHGKGHPLKLTIFCPTDGDVLSLAGMLH
jgi:hypothetical protein